MATAPEEPELSRPLAELARPMVWLPDYKLLNPHRDWKPGSVAWLRQRGVLRLPPGPLFYNKERGGSEEWREALSQLRRVAPDRRIGLFYTAAESLYREYAWSEPGGPRPEQVNAWLELRAGADGLERFCDYTTVYGYQLTPDREQHLRAVVAQRDLTREHFDKPVYLVTWTHLHPSAKQWGQLAGEPMPLDDWAWEIREVWPLFDGVIVFAPEGVTEAQINVWRDAASARTAGWIQHESR